MSVLLVSVLVLVSVGTVTPSTAITHADTRVIVVSEACHTSRDPTPSASVVLSTTHESGSPVAFVSVPLDGVPRAHPFVTIAPADPTATARAVPTLAQGVIPAQVVRSAS